MNLNMIKHSIGIITLFLALVGCKNQQAIPVVEPTGPNYTRPLPEGQRALQYVSVRNWPNLGDAWQSRDLFLQDAINHSIRWFDAPSSKQWFPIEGISHEQAKQSVIAFGDVLRHASTEANFIAEVKSRFDLYRSVGYDGEGTVLFTGYYAPDFQASRYRTPQFTAPLYTRPDELITDPATGESLGRKRHDGMLTNWPTRDEIESTGLLDGTELVWVKDKLDAYIIHVNGSARLRMQDGELMFIGYAGKTDQPYTGLGQSVLDAGLLSANKLSLRSIRRLYEKNPQQITNLINKNKSFIFFKEYDGSKWPSGSLGVPVTQERSIATDKKIFPRGGVVLVDTTIRTLAGERKQFMQFMTDQDTGGAIRAPGRSDLYMGVGAIAGIKAGGQYNEGQLFYFFLKPELVAAVHE